MAVTEPPRKKISRDRDDYTPGQRKARRAFLREQTGVASGHVSQGFGSFVDVY